jgi:hypothetical protein
MSRVNSIVADVESQLTEEYEKSLEQVKEDFSTQLNSYLEYMVTEWMNENALAVESGLRSEVVEGFISGLKTLFTEHYIDIPEDKVDVVEGLTATVSELEEQLNAQIHANMELNAELKEHMKNDALYTVSEGLTQTQVDKLCSLAESVEYTTHEEFVGKIESLKESFFGTKGATPSTLNEGVDIIEEKTPAVNTDPSIAMYTKAITQTLNNK